MMKNKTIITVGVVGMVIFIAVAGFFWYKFFLDIGSDGRITVGNTSKGDLVLTDRNRVYATYSELVVDPNKVEGYEFSVENKGLSSAKYRIKFVEVSPKVVNDGCNSKSVFKANELDYQLFVNDSLIREGNLSSVVNTTLNEQSISVDTKDKYELKVWLNDDLTNSHGKHYHYKVELEVLD